MQLIMDGNSRWAEAQGLPAWVGHERGVAALKAAVIQAREWCIPALTVRPGWDPFWPMQHAHTQPRSHRQSMDSAGCRHPHG
jgi:hypothetical protein